ncbi:MAG: papain fold toxin domain-containing protein [Nostoc sp.]
MNNASLHRQLSAIAEQFSIFECVPCAIALHQFLNKSLIWLHFFILLQND